MHAEQLDFEQALRADHDRAQALVHARAMRDEGTARVDRHSPDEWKTAADAAIRSLASLGQPFTASDVQALDIGEPPNPKAWGSRFLTASKQGVIRRVGYTPSTRASVHGHPVAVWQGTAAGAA